MVLILNQYVVIVGEIADMIDAVTKEYYQRLKMSHAEQVEQFGWCMCDDDGGHIPHD